MLFVYTKKTLASLWLTNYSAPKSTAWSGDDVLYVVGDVVFDEYCSTMYRLLPRQIPTSDCHICEMRKNCDSHCCQCCLEDSLYATLYACRSPLIQEIFRMFVLLSACLDFLLSYYCYFVLLAADSAKELRKHNVACVSLWPGAVLTELMPYLEPLRASVVVLNIFRN